MAGFLILPRTNLPRLTLALTAYGISGGLLAWAGAALASTVRELRESQRRMEGAQTDLRVLVGELAHRGRNGLTVVMAIISHGHKALDLRLARKTVGPVPAGTAARLDPAAPEMLVAEGVFTTLSATERFDLPGWALMSTRNLKTWCAPPGVRSVLIAADRGLDGEGDLQPDGEGDPTVADAGRDGCLGDPAYAREPCARGSREIAGRRWPCALG